MTLPLDFSMSGKACYRQVTAEPVGLLDTNRLGLTDPSSISAEDLIDPDASNRLSLLPEG